MKKALMILTIIALIVLPLAMYQNGEFSGTDDKAVSTIQEINKSYQPWFEGIKLFESPEIISTFFAVQADIGAGFMGFYVGFMKGKKQKEVA